MATPIERMGILRSWEHDNSDAIGCIAFPLRDSALV
jgi:hypothetical protein